MTQEFKTDPLGLSKPSLSLSNSLLTPSLVLLELSRPYTVRSMSECLWLCIPKRTDPVTPRAPALRSHSRDMTEASSKIFSSRGSLLLDDEISLILSSGRK